MKHTKLFLGGTLDIEDLKVRFPIEQYRKILYGGNIMTRRELQEKYVEEIKAIEVANPKESGETYDMDVCLDMLIADMKANAIGQEVPYPFEGEEGFDYVQFAVDYESLA